MRLVCLVLVYSILLVTTPFALAQTRTNGTYKVDVLVTNGKKSKEEKATLSYGENSLKIRNLITPTSRARIIPIRKSRYCLPAAQSLRLSFLVFSSFPFSL